MYTVKILYQDKEGFIKMAIFYHIQNITIKEEDISLQDDDGKIHHYNYDLVLNIEIYNPSLFKKTVY
jgi:hypothetical protein